MSVIDRVSPNARHAARIPAHILIVDDIADNREVLSRRLTRYGYRTTEARDGHEALRLIEQTAFDMILLDVLMPGLSGLDVLRVLRSRHASRDLPVLMVTANALAEQVAEARAIGADDYITKPVDFALALASIEMHLELARTARRVDDARSLLRLARV